jgi:hypothetical protein
MLLTEGLKSASLKRGAREDLLSSFENPLKSPLYNEGLSTAYLKLKTFDGSDQNLSAVEFSK